MTAHEYIRALESKKELPAKMQLKKEWLISLIIDVWAKGYDEGKEEGKRITSYRSRDMDHFSKIFPWVNTND